MKIHSNWHKLIVDYNDVQIDVSHSYVIREPGRNDFRFDSYSRSRMMNQRVTSNSCILRWMKEINQELLVFESPVIYSDEKTLHMKILLQEKGAIYLNPNDNSEYYWDLDFLEA